MIECGDYIKKYVKIKEKLLTFKIKVGIISLYNILKGSIL